jgi:hypothetical protein
MEHGRWKVAGETAGRGQRFEGRGLRVRVRVRVRARLPRQMRLEVDTRMVDGVVGVDVDEIGGDGGDVQRRDEEGRVAATSSGTRGESEGVRV